MHIYVVRELLYRYVRHTWCVKEPDMDDENVFTSLCCLIYVVKEIDIYLVKPMIKMYSQATVEVYIIHSSREKYSMILLN